MPEDQNYNGDQWNKAINAFLEKVLNWKQIGISNVDVQYGNNASEKYGLDSVFGYRTHDRGHQQVVIVEAKNRDTFKSVGKSKLQDWVNVLLKKVETVPATADFQRKFPVDADAQFSVGLIAVWVRDLPSFDAAEFAERLKQLEVHEKKNPIYLYVLDNYLITRMLSVYDEVNRLQNTEEYRNATFYYPPNGSDLVCDGTVIPLDALFSDILFYKVTKRRPLMNGKGFEEYSAVLCFYFGAINYIDDLKFIDLAIRDSGLHDAGQIEVYIPHSTDTIRSEIAMHVNTSNFNLSFKRLTLRNDLPSWLGVE